DLGMARPHGQRDAAFTGAAVEHAGGPEGDDLALEEPELLVPRAPGDQRARLAADEDAELSLEILERHPSPETLVLTLLGVEIGLAAPDVREIPPDAGGLLGVAGIGMRGARGLDELEPTCDVVAIQLEPRPLNHRLDV